MKINFNSIMTKIKYILITTLCFIVTINIYAYVMLVLFIKTIFMKRRALA
ncbi:hypothetical protein bsdtb5_01910 [Anaeromicropila herbilytica]|uniref:Uncharacterized protein n=1 Tax=Anaeromicropila herbilytica TaxID=2785025 RepID=A0A7R7IBL5_9FIRM|nr:hypothetical protein bsdtb5_01910 [Anaeromicropila herbilytica]